MSENIVIHIGYSYSNVISTTNLDAYVCAFAKFDQFLPVRSHFDTKRPVNFFHIATFPSPTFGLLFAFHCPFFFTKNNKLECRDVLKTITVTSGVCVCAKFDQFLPVRSHFDTKRPVNFFHIATFQSATFGRPLFAFVLCVLRQKIIKKPKMLGKRIDRRNR